MEPCPGEAPRSADCRPVAPRPAAVPYDQGGRIGLSSHMHGVAWEADVTSEPKEPDLVLSRRTLIAAFAAQSLLMACGRGSQRPTDQATGSSAMSATTTTVAVTTSSTSTTTTLPPPSLVMMNDAGVTPDEIQLITRILELAEAELGDTGALQVFAYSDLDELLRSGAFDPGAAEHRRRIYTQGNVAEAGAGKIIIYMPNFRRHQDKEKIVIHEYYHELQAYLRGFRLLSPDVGVPRAGPAWLIEGSAEHFGYKLASAHGLTSYSAARQRGVRASRQLGPLNSYENLLSFNGADREGIWDFGVLTIEFMVSRYGEDKVKKVYWQAAKETAEWQKAFVDTFGESVDAFYGAYEEYRSTLR